MIAGPAQWPGTELEKSCRVPQRVFILQRISRARIFAVHSLDAMQVAPKTAVSSLLTMTFPSILAKKKQNAEIVPEKLPSPKDNHKANQQQQRTGQQKPSAGIMAQDSPPCCGSGGGPPDDRSCWRGGSSPAGVLPCSCLHLLNAAAEFPLFARLLLLQSVHQLINHQNQWYLLVLTGTSIVICEV